MLRLSDITCTYHAGKNQWRFNPLPRSQSQSIDFFQHRILPGLNIVILGRTASGKSTLAESFKVLGARIFGASKIVKSYIDSSPKTPEKTGLESLRQQGLLWPDEITAATITRELGAAKKGWVLEGFPRTAKAAELLLHDFRVDAALFLDLPPEIARKRSLIRRKDTDQEAVITNKIAAFERENEAVLHLLAERNIPIIRIDGTLSPETIKEQALAALKAEVSRKGLTQVAAHWDFKKPLTHIMSTVDTRGMSRELVRKLIRAGATVFRFNFSFIKTREQRKKAAEILKLIKEVAAEEKIIVGCAVDLSGPSVRIGNLAQPLTIKKGQSILLTQEQQEDTVPIYISDPQADFISSASAALAKKEGGQPLKILIDHAQVILEIESIEGNSIRCKAAKDGTIKPGKGVNFPGIHLATSSITPKDEKDLSFALENGFDYIVHSFSKKAQDVTHLRNLMQKLGRVVPIITKIETEEALEEENLDAIVQETDMIMIGRGDLADETGARYLVPIAQDRIDYYCRLWGKPLVLATEVYSSMMTEMVPNRADADNVYRGIRDSVDMIMLSGAESILTPHPVLVMETIVEQALATEKALKGNELFRLMQTRRRLWFRRNLAEKIIPALPQPVFQDQEKRLSVFAEVAVHYIERKKIQAIIVATNDIRIPRYLSRLIPHLKIVVVTSKESLAKELLLYGGVFPVITEKPDGHDLPLKVLYGVLNQFSPLKKGEKALLILAAEESIIQGKTRIELVQKA